ncbi:hypothetical protein TREMEDRAFT_62954 [Tremella mesenterica DSM 1558]|uniref:uncharacterized protein n=1 Tax=Tremella mesenterica (strain ATCC 24925 / CBS 8224 / DSM 1558 / NBRC 9311 / NRRL Y-6157 / RJB 2259-6 / UBC 559-6) TaxID=578456 RepID=UPI0003F4A3E1|nr:uncharacterized protein TREMEDRAFT_62954 [Tremella mesenterica DSM 1558]EIW69222.1 hypothetical protein TREMEDRAFT_62954 [Tremella mesenterica DSM 1558]
MSNNDDLSALSKLIPTLTGTETFVRWRRGVRNYLFDKGAQGHLSGLEPEPFRRLVNPAVPTDHSVVFPPDTIAGEAPPDATNSTTAVALTATQRTTWLDWANKERKARSTLIFTISPGLAAQVEDLWSAQEIWARITAQHQVKTTARRNDLNQRISLLRLVENANFDTMHAHLETFSELVAEALGAGAHIDDGDRSERFLLSLGRDFAPLRQQWDLRPDTQKSWDHLVTAYHSIADTRRLEQEMENHTQQAISAVLVNKDAIKKDKGRSGSRVGKGRSNGAGSEHGGNKEKEKGQGKTRKEGKRGKDESDSEEDEECDWCGKYGHSVEDCRIKKRGDLSKSQLQEAIKEYRSKHQVNVMRDESPEPIVFGNLSSIL